MRNSITDFFLELKQPAFFQQGIICLSLVELGYKRFFMYSLCALFLHVFLMLLHNGTGLSSR